VPAERHEIVLDPGDGSGEDSSLDPTPMTRRVVTISVALAGLFVLSTAALSLAADAGRIKTVRGTAWVERAGARLPATVGTAVRQDDVIVTGPDGTVGITFADDSRLSIGPDTTLAIERFAFNPTTHEGAHETALRRGTLAAVSGKLARQSPDAMKVRTPAAVLGVRGTEFAVRAGDPRP
jgi:hypothetical protein